MSLTGTSGRPLAEGLLAFAVLSALLFAVAWLSGMRASCAPR
jgi:hypothetical protein